MIILAWKLLHILAIQRYCLEAIGLFQNEKKGSTANVAVFALLNYSPVTLTI